ncbi:MAG: caspase family protein, partial [Parasphingorhabdus sp.]
NMVDGKWSELRFESLDTTVLASNGNILAIAGAMDDVIGLYDIESGTTLPALDYGNITAGGFVPGKPLFWAFSQQGGIRIWDTRDWSELLTAYFFYNQGFMAVTPDGRYDSNIHPYKAQFRWLVSDAPFQSLNPDAFSRDYYTPGIGYRWLACSIEKICKDAFEPVKSITNLTRTLPEVTIRSVEPGSEPTRATVTVAIKEGVNPEATNGKTHSGIYDPRILRNHQLVLRSAKDAQQQRLDITAWRKVKRIEADGTHVLKAEVMLPSGTGPRDRTPIITAYAFNEDRIKGETAEYRYQRPDVRSQAPRAYVVNIGIDHYRQQRLNLSYAGADARLMGERLADIHGYDTRHLSIFSTGSRQASGTTGQPDFVSKNILRSLMAVLAGENRVANLRALQKRGINASMLEKATPDDLVILTYAGHGWADKSGDFFLIPSEAEWSSSAGTPERKSLISSNELAAWLLPVDAGAMTFIIDACHSAASVENGSFIPGPLGDVGLGQLAFDKGVRILSATQADDVALEDARLRQGLLTYALAGEGLLPSGGKADQDRDGQIHMTEWLNYAVRRLPALSEEVSVGRFSGTSAPGTRAIVFHEAPANAPKRNVQKPSLFDFTIDSDNIVLRNRGG